MSRKITFWFSYLGWWLCMHLTQITLEDLQFAFFSQQKSGCYLQVWSVGKFSFKSHIRIRVWLQILVEDLSFLLSVLLWHANGRNYLVLLRLPFYLCFASLGKYVSNWREWQELIKNTCKDANLWSFLRLLTDNLPLLCTNMSDEQAIYIVSITNNNNTNVLKMGILTTKYVITQKIW